MKKILAGIAVLAFVAAAQADLLSSWSFSGGTATQADGAGNPSGASHVSFGTLTRVTSVETPMGTQTTAANQFAANNWQLAGAGVQFTADVPNDYEIAGAEMVAWRMNRTGTGPTEVQWSVNGNAVGTAWTVNSSSTTTTGYSASLGDLSGSNTIMLAATSGNAGQSGGGLRILNSTDGENVLRMTGTIRETTSVPEPATMSLLGLGALAMVLRRKLRK